MFGGDVSGSHVLIHAGPVPRPKEHASCGSLNNVFYTITITILMSSLGPEAT